MKKTLLAWMVVLVVAGTGPGQDDKDKKKPERKYPGAFLTAEEAGPDFKVQGEYEGEMAGKGKFAAQVVAKGSGKFEVNFLAGGLPGAGWDAKTRTKVLAKTEDGKVVLADKAWDGGVSEGQLSGKTKDGDAFALKKVTRKSPAEGAKPPDGAVVLFDGSSAAEWGNGKIMENNLLFCGTTSKKKFGAGKWHLEFRLAFEPTRGGQGRGNSGVYILGREIQVLDSFGLKGENNECGGYYGEAKPLVNMCLPPLTWQTYDVLLQPAEKGGMLSTVWHNGVKIHDQFHIKGGKESAINFQDHGNYVVYRNIWFVPAEKK